MNVDILWVDGVAFEATSSDNHKVIMDGSPAYGGLNRGARPMELILMGLGGCASFDLVTILQKARQNVSNVRCKITAKRADSIPAVFTDIHLHFIVEGTAVKASQVEKAIQLSADKYCSASKMLGDGGVNITHDFELIDIPA